MKPAMRIPAAAALAVLLAGPQGAGAGGDDGPGQDLAVTVELEVAVTMELPAEETVVGWEAVGWGESRMQATDRRAGAYRGMEEALERAGIAWRRETLGVDEEEKDRSWFRKLPERRWRATRWERWTLAGAWPAERLVALWGSREPERKPGRRVAMERVEHRLAPEGEEGKGRGPGHRRLRHAAWTQTGERLRTVREVLRLGETMEVEDTGLTVTDAPWTRRSETRGGVPGVRKSALLASRWWLAGPKGGARRDDGGNRAPGVRATLKRRGIARRVVETDRAGFEVEVWVTGAPGAETGVQAERAVKKIREILAGEEVRHGPASGRVSISDELHWSGEGVLERAVERRTARLRWTVWTEDAQEAETLRRRLASESGSIELARPDGMETNVEVHALQQWRADTRALDAELLKEAIRDAGRQAEEDAALRCWSGPGPLEVRVGAEGAVHPRPPEEGEVLMADAASGGSAPPIHGERREKRMVVEMTFTARAGGEGAGAPAHCLETAPGEEGEV